MSIEIKNVVKKYGKKVALNDVSLTLENGIYGLLGENGAGKSTLLNIMVTSLAQTSGQVLYNGMDIRDKKSGYLDTLGYMPQTPKFYKNYTACEFLKYIAALKGIKKNVNAKTDELLALVNLTESKDVKLGAYSGGMLQRIGIAQALLNDPEILILDEPTAGLDPTERIRLRNLISSIAENRTVILATHIVPDIEYIANRVILLDNGEICRNDTPENLCNEIKNCVWRAAVPSEYVDKVVTRYKVSNIHKTEDRYIVRIVSDKQPGKYAKQATPTLEDVFLYHAGEVTL